MIVVRGRPRLRAYLQIDSEEELTYLRNGGILPHVVREALH